MPNSKVIDGRLHVQDDNGVYKSNSADNFNVPDDMKVYDRVGPEPGDYRLNDDRVSLKVMTKGKKTEDGKSVKCKLPVEMDGERKMIGIDLDEDSLYNHGSSGRSEGVSAYVDLNVHDRLVASVKDKDGSVDKVEFTVGRIAELNNEAWKSYLASKFDPAKAKELTEKYPETQEFFWKSYLASNFDPAKAKELAERMTVPYTDKSVDMSKYPETQAMLNSKWDRQPHEKIADTVSYYESDEFLASQAELAEFAERYPDKYPTRHNVDAALGLPYESDESQSDGAEFE